MSPTRPPSLFPAFLALLDALLCFCFVLIFVVDVNMMYLELPVIIPLTGYLRALFGELKMFPKPEMAKKYWEMSPGVAEKCRNADHEVQSQPDSTSDSHGSQNVKPITVAPVPKTYIRMPRKGFPPNPMPENYVRLDQITDELYDKFCKEVLDDALQPCTPQERKLLDNMSSSGDFGAAVDFYDEIMGELPVVMVHMRTSKVFLSPSLRERCIQKVIAVKKLEANPICAALAHIQQLFVGFPPEIRLRHMLVAELERQEPGTLSEDDKRLMALPPSARFTARPAAHLRRCSVQDTPSSAQEPVTRRVSSRTPKPRERTTMDSKGEIITIDATETPPLSSASKAPPMKPKPLYINMMVPLDDAIYDKIASVLAERCTLDSIEDEPLRLAIENIRDSGEVMVEEWTEEQFFCPPGLRLRANDEAGRIHLRKSEVHEVRLAHVLCYLHERPQSEILNAVDAQYIGIATKTNIDIVAMEETLYGERSYNQALFLTDLYSGYTFARALTDSPDLAIIVRHVMDIFGSFGPPEVYRTHSAEYSHIIADVMLDIERLFKVSIKNMGAGRNLTRDLCSYFVSSCTHRVIMFARHAWRDEACPPWVSPEPTEEIEQDPSRLKPQKRRKTFLALMKEVSKYDLLKGSRVVFPAPPRALGRKPMQYVQDREEEEGDSSHLDTVKDLKMYANSLVMSRKRLKQQVLPVYVPVYNEEGKLVNPGTGYLFQLYDRIYVRNPHYNPDYRASKSRSHIARYYRGIIVDIDTDLVESMYKVLYWEDDPHDVDAMSPSEWPAADDTYDCASSWFGPWDVTASTAHLAKLRTVAPEFCTEYTTTRRRTIDMRCRCESPSCAGFAHMKCQRKFSTECCLKSPYDCAFHKQDDRHQEEEDSPIPGDNSALFTSQFMFQHRQSRAAEMCGPSGFPIKLDTYTAEADSSPNQSSRGQRRPRIPYSANSAPAAPEKRYTFRDGVLVEISSASELEGQPRRGAPPVTRKRRLPATDEAAALQSPSTRTGREWPAIPTSTGRTDSVATTSDDGGHVQFVSPDPESMHSPTPSPTPSACYEVEISPDDTSAAQSITPEGSSCNSDATQKSKRSTPRLQDQDRGQSANGISWDIPEMSLRPRVVPSRDHPYERTTKTSRPPSPTTTTLVVDSMAKRLEKAVAAERRSYSARAVSGSNEGTPTSASDGSKSTYRLAAVPRSASHVHPFDAELMAVGFIESLFFV
ncbi:hypothetical protein OSTOST_06938 [Ostertagia ostertagi]